MTDNINDSKSLTLVAIDIAKKSHDACIQFTDGMSMQLKIENSIQGYQRLWFQGSPFTLRKYRKQSPNPHCLLA